MKDVGGGGWGVYSQTYATGMYHPLKGRRGGGEEGRRGGGEEKHLRNMVLCCHICKHYNLG